MKIPVEQMWPGQRGKYNGQPVIRTFCGHDEYRGKSLEYILYEDPPKAYTVLVELEDGDTWATYCKEGVIRYPDLWVEVKYDNGSKRL